MACNIAWPATEFSCCRRASPTKSNSSIAEEPNRFACSFPPHCLRKRDPVGGMCRPPTWASSHQLMPARRCVACEQRWLYWRRSRRLEEALLLLLDDVTTLAEDHRRLAGRVPAKRPATRRRLLGRLQRAREMIDDHQGRPPSLA